MSVTLSSIAGSVSVHPAVQQPSESGASALAYMTTCTYGTQRDNANACFSLLLWSQRANYDRTPITHINSVAVTPEPVVWLTKLRPNGRTPYGATLTPELTHSFIRQWA